MAKHSWQIKLKLVWSWVCRWRWHKLMPTHIIVSRAISWSHLQERGILYWIRLVTPSGVLWLTPQINQLQYHGYRVNTCEMKRTSAIKDNVFGVSCEPQTNASSDI